MLALGEGLSYLLIDGGAYLLGKLNHKSFVEVKSDEGDRGFAFTIDTNDDYLDNEKLSDMRIFEDFLFPIRKIYDLDGRDYSVRGSIRNGEELEGRIIVQKVAYSDGNNPVGYIYFEFDLYESERREDYILVYKSKSKGHIIRTFKI